MTIQTACPACGSGIGELHKADCSIRTLFPIYDLGDEPLVTLGQLKRDVEEVIGNDGNLPYLAFVSGPGMNLRVEFNDYDAEVHRGIVAHGLMELIIRGADRILIVAETWLRVGEMPNWHGVIIHDARPEGDTAHFAEFEGKTALGPWKECQPALGCNLTELFERAEGLAAS